MLILPRFTQKSPPDLSLPRSRSRGASALGCSAGSRVAPRAVGISQEQGLTPKIHTLPIYRLNPHWWCCPGRETLAQAKAKHPKHQTSSQALVTALPSPQLSCRHRKPGGTWGHQTITNSARTRWPKPTFAQLLDILRAKGRQGRSLDSPSLLLYCFITLKTGSKTISKSNSSPTGATKRGLRKAWLFATQL